VLTNKTTISTNPTKTSPFRVFVHDVDNRFFDGQIIFTVIDDSDGCEAPLPRGGGSGV